jgi:hypothetical protein
VDVAQHLGEPRKLLFAVFCVCICIDCLMVICVSAPANYNISYGCVIVNLICEQFHLLKFYPKFHLNFVGNCSFLINKNFEFIHLLTYCIAIFESYLVCYFDLLSFM